MNFLKDYRYPVIYIQLPVRFIVFFFDLCLSTFMFVVFQVNIF